LTVGKGIRSNIGAASLRRAYHTVVERLNQAHPSIDGPRWRNDDGRRMGALPLIFGDLHDFIILERDDFVSGRLAPIAHYLL